MTDKMARLIEMDKKEIIRNHFLYILWVAMSGLIGATYCIYMTNTTGGIIILIFTILFCFIDNIGTNLLVMRLRDTR